MRHRLRSLWLYGLFSLLVLPAHGFWGTPSPTPAYSVHQIALLLPFSGQHAASAYAIRDGFLASYYTTEHAYKPQLRFYDSTEGDLSSLYETAVAEGADLIIGPLTKEEVSQLAYLRHYPVPILALNHLPHAHNLDPHFVMYSLAPEREVEQVAHKARGQGFLHAALFVPDTLLGKRMSRAFHAEWEQLGGTLTQVVYLSPKQDLAAVVRRVLGITVLPAARKNKKAPPPQRNSPVDVIVMAISPKEARQVKPLLDFYYASDIPIYATSSVYSGYPDPANDHDINGVIFCDMPGLLDTQQLFLSHITEPHAHLDESYPRLFAMGMDAYHLSNQLEHLRSSGKHVFKGATGQLTLTRSYVYRKLAWAQMVEGRPRLLQ